MEVDEIPSVFVCNGEELLGIAHRPAQYSRRGVLIIVGGPQYRVGSHRQFVQLARHLASAGVAVFRFDYRGMGDSDGYTTAWETGLDIAAAIHEFIGLCPELDELILWGLCDGATSSDAPVVPEVRADLR